MILLFHALIEHKTQQEKFDTLYYQFRQKLFYIAKSVVKNDADAEDVLQESFVKIAKHIEQIDDDLGKRAFSFCATVTKNTALTFLRTAASADALEDVEYKLSDQTDVADILFREENYKALLSAIDDLKEPYKGVLILYYAHDCSIRQIAKLTDTPSNTVKQQLRRARALLIHDLEKGGVTLEEIKS